MDPQEKLTTQQFIVDRLQDIQRKAEAGNYGDALASIKEVKAADTKNIYLIALEKQIAKLNDTSIPPETRGEIVKSLPPMIERAITDTQRRAASAPKVDEGQKGQKEAALEKLKSQYFQRADDYVSKHEYQRALEEIRRIYIIEPGSVVAKEYEQKIEQLSALHDREVEQVAQKAEVKEEKKKAEPVAEPPKEKVVSEEEPKKSKLPIIAAAAVVVLAVVGWLIFSRGPSSTQLEKEPAPQPVVTEQIETPKEPVAATPTPKSTKETAPPPAASKQPAKTPKAQPESKPVKPAATPEQKPAQPAAAQQQKPPATTQPEQKQKQTTQQPPATQPETKTPPPQPAEEPKVAETTPSPMPFVAIESPPEVVKLEPPQYPEIAIKMGIQGRVFVEVTVDAQGKPIQTKVVKSSSDVFNDAAIEAAMKSTYKPAMMSTGPVTAKVTVPFNFRIRR